MADNTSMETGVGTHQRVALDLAKTIYTQASDSGSLTRDEWLKLYHECLEATFGRQKSSR